MNCNNRKSDCANATICPCLLFEENKMLDIQFDCEDSCLSCGNAKEKTAKIRINRRKNGENIVAFNLCKECFTTLAKEFHKKVDIC